MYDHHEDAVRIAYYFVWDTEADDYFVLLLCEDCAAGRDGDVRIAGNPPHGEPKRCEDCDSPNEAALRENEIGLRIGIYEDHAASAGSDELEYAYLCEGCAEERGADGGRLETVAAGWPCSCDECGSPNRDEEEEEEE